MSPAAAQIGTTNQIDLTAKAAGFIDQGSFYNGSNYAWVNAAGTYVRGINYTGDTGANTSAGTTSLASSTYQQFTGNITAQTAAAFTTLNDAGAYKLVDRLRRSRGKRNSQIAWGNGYLQRWYGVPRHQAELNS